MRKSLALILPYAFRATAVPQQLKSRLPIAAAERSYWQGDTGSLLLQEHDGLLAYIYCYEIQLERTTNLTISSKQADIHALYLLQADKAIRIKESSGQTIDSINPQRARYLYLPAATYSLVLPAGNSLLFGLYFNTKIFRQGHDRPFDAIKPLLQARHNKQSKALSSLDFRIATRSQNHIRKLAQGLHHKRLSNESLILSQVIKLMELSQEKINEKTAPIAPQPFIKLEQARQLLAHYINEEIEMPAIGLIADELSIDIRLLNQQHRLRYGNSLQHYRNQLMISKAQQLLLEGRTVSQTAYTLGYSSPAAFVRFFKSQVKLSPEQWGKQNRT